MHAHMRDTYDVFVLYGFAQISRLFRWGRQDTFLLNTALGVWTRYTGFEAYLVQNLACEPVDMDNHPLGSRHVPI